MTENKITEDQLNKIHDFQKEITALSVGAKGARTKQYERLQSEIADKGVFRPGTGRKSLSKEDAVALLLSKPFRREFVELMRAALQKYENYALLNVIDADKAGKAKTFLQIITISFILIFLILKSYNLDIPQILSTNSLFYLMLITTLITFYTGVHYVYYNYKTLENLFINR